MTNSNRLLDAEIAVRDHAWRWVDRYGRRLLLPPIGDPRIFWAARWDADGLPHWLPKYSEGAKR